MLEKSLKKTYFDAHFHYLDSFNSEGFDPVPDWHGCSCAHSQDEWNAQNKIEQVFNAYGIHPMQAAEVKINEVATFIEQLCQSKSICAIGEVGFDYFTPELKAQNDAQKQAWEIQLEIALKYQLPIVVHCRKASERLFEYGSELKKLPSVLFHSFMGTPVEALSLCNRGINGFFSFGKQIFNNNKKVIACVKELPINKLLLETDAPFQYLKGQNKTTISEIEKIYNGAIELRPDIDQGDFFKILEKNFYECFCLKSKE